MFYAIVFFFNDTATTEIYTRPYTLSLHDALPISARGPRPLDSQRRAGHREREPPHPAEPRARAAGDGHLADHRLSRRHRLRRPSQYGGRPPRHHVRAVRHLHAELPARAAPDLPLRR